MTRMGLRGLIWCIWAPWCLLLSESVAHFGLLSESVPHFGEKAATTVCTADLDLLRQMPLTCTCLTRNAWCFGGVAPAHSVATQAITGVTFSMVKHVCFAQHPHMDSLRHSVFKSKRTRLLQIAIFKINCLSKRSL